MPQRRWALMTITLVLAMTVLDGATSNLAMPTIARDLDASPAATIWVVNALEMTMAVGLLPLSLVGDIYGYRRIYRIGLILFTLGSLACVLSSTLPTLMAARAIQGIGSAGIFSVNIALILLSYPQRLLGSAGRLAQTRGPKLVARTLKAL